MTEFGFKSQHLSIATTMKNSRIAIFCCVEEWLGLGGCFRTFCFPVGPASESCRSIDRQVIDYSRSRFRLQANENPCRSTDRLQIDYSRSSGIPHR